MSAPELAPRGTFPGIIAVWITAVLSALAIGIFVPVDWRMAWMTVGFGGCIILTFVVQLAYGRSQGFIDRIAITIAGVLVGMGLVSAGFGVAALIPGSLIPG